MKTEKFNVSGMTCAACQANVERCVRKLDGTNDVNVSLLANQMIVSYDENKLQESDIIHAVEAIGYGAESTEKDGQRNETGGSFKKEWETRKERANRSTNNMKTRLIRSVIILIPLMYVAMGHMLPLPMPPFLSGTENALICALVQLLLTIPILFLNRAFFTRGFKALIKRAPNMDSLVAIGSGASFIYGLFAMFKMAYGFGHGEMQVVHEYAHALYFESAAMILTLVTVGKYLEAKSKSKTSDALGKLVDLTPKTATVLVNGKEKRIPAEAIKAGDTVVIRPGEVIPVDGTVLQGNGFVDQAAITGESIPVEKNPGDEVISATINKNGSFRFTASKVGNDTTLAQIIRLVDEAGNSKAPIARLADRVSAVFVPIVMGIALIAAIIWLIAGQSFEFALSNAISVLVISCPCALGLATPVAIMVGTGKAAEYGILIKSAQSLETLHSADTIVLDKTGTITSGTPSVTDVELLDSRMDRAAFLSLAASAEALSEHPLAGAVTQYAREQHITWQETKEFEAIAGRGIRAILPQGEVLAGNTALFQEKGVNCEPAQAAIERFSKDGKTPLLFALNGKIQGVIAVADTVKESSANAIERFKKMGLHVIMLTGDNHQTAKAIQEKLQIEEAIADVLPTEKEAQIRRLQNQGRKVIMVGDGINDAPALMRADIGMAIGAGTDIAIDSADVVLMKNSLEDAATAIELSKAVIRDIKMNLFWAFFYNILGIPLAAGALFPAFGLRLSPMIGSAAMSLSSVCVVTNALRLRFFKDKNKVVQTADQPSADKNNRFVEQTKLTTQQKGNEKMKKILTVEGMMCNHCKMHVENALKGVDGVEDVQVNLEQKSAEVTLTKDVADDVLSAAVKEAGYEVTGCQTA